MQVQTKQITFHSNNQLLNMGNKQISNIMQTEQLQQNMSEDKNTNNINININNNMHTSINIIISKPSSPQESPINCSQLTSINIHNNTQINTRTNENQNDNDNDNGSQNLGKASKRGKHKYSKITPQIKKIFIQRIVFENMSIKQSAESVNINYSSAKAIISQHKNKSKPQPQPLSQPQVQPQLQSQIKSQSSCPIASSISSSMPIPFIICSYKQISEQFLELDEQSKCAPTSSSKQSIQGSNQNKYPIDAIVSTIGGLVVDQWQCDQGNSKNISTHTRINKIKK